MNRERVISSPAFESSPAGRDACGQQEVENYALPFLLSILTLTAFRLVALFLSNTELFFDEAQYWFWSRELAFGYYSKPPLIAWIIRGAGEICGQGEACIRAPSPLIHAATATVVFAIARQLYGARAGFWSGLTYATLPGVSLSSSLISTDAPLLFFVALALYSLIMMQASRSWLWALVLGASLGFGLLSKYAMAYVLVCLALYALWRPAGRALLVDARLYAALAIGAALIAPNILWNLENSFATFSHTADNANWDGSFGHPDKMMQFLGGQLGVFGPILFVTFVSFCIAWLRNPASRNDAGEAARFLLAFSVPVIAMMTAQAFLSRAHANWAAFAYISATVLITAAMLRGSWLQLLRTSIGLHLGAAILIGLGGILAGNAALPGGADPYARVLGWRAIAETAAQRAKAGGFKAIATDKRALAAELLYYLRDEAIPVVALRGSGPPSDHFELTRPLSDDTPRPVLLVSFRAEGPSGSHSLGQAEIPAGPSVSRRIYFHALNDASR